VGNEAKGACYPQHHPMYTIDEDALEIGTALYAQYAMDFLKL
jgi:metal-dependent amidase/aminoacylase/carboxypeptidase family protein